MRYTRLGRTNEHVPVIGYGTWRLGGGWWSEDRSADDKAIDAIVYAVKRGCWFVDTAEAYGGGHTEELVGAAIRRLKEEGDYEFFVATKVAPEHLHYDDVLRSCAASLKRLGVKQVDLYQVHWPNDRIPIAETMSAFERLVDEGRTRYIGVSNFSAEQVEEAQTALRKHELVSDQVSYSVFDRSPEGGVLPYCRKNGLTVIAYSPLGKGRINSEHPIMVKLDGLAAKYGKTRAQIALNWLVRDDRVVAIPKAADSKHIDENAAAADFEMTPEDYEALRRT
jgi:diketogulonate reductase-like aldo/keto reductase